MRALSKAKKNMNAYTPSTSSSAQFAPPATNGTKRTPVVVDLTREDDLYQQTAPCLPAPVLRIPGRIIPPPSKTTRQLAAEVISRSPTVSKISKSKSKKPSPSPYIWFCKENRERIKEKNVGASFGEIGRVLGLEWKMISAEEKNVIFKNEFLIYIVSTAKVFLVAHQCFIALIS